MIRLHPRRTAAILAAVLASSAIGVLLLGTAATASSGQVLQISAASHMVLRFNTTHVKARPGRITLVMHNPSNSGMSHGIALSGHRVHKIGKIVDSGHSTSVTATLGTGSYTFYCPVPGHEAAGMKGTLSVR